MKSLRKPLIVSGGLLIVVLLAAGVWGSLSWFSGDAPNLPESASAEADESSPGVRIVELSPAKLRKAKIQTSMVERRSLREWRTIPGRVQYNQTRHIELRAPTDGILREVLVKPGHSVEPGTLMAVFWSSSIGKARAEVLQLDAQLALATRKWEWERKIADHTRELIEVLTNGPDVAEIEETFKTRTLGQARETLLSAYAQSHLANQMLQGTESLRNSGAMSARTLQERTANQRTAEAAYKAATEQVLFDTQQRSALAEAEYENAQRQLQIGQQKLNALLGYESKTPANESVESLSRVELRSPIAGTVERISFAPNERIAEKDSLFVVADTKTLWVAAEIRDSDWAALNIAVGNEVKVQTPALQDEPTSARVIYVGREVSDDSHSLPLVAEIENTKGRFRPGLFARVNVPIGQAVETIAVPPGAVMQHEGTKFVFVEKETGRFARVDVVTGMETPEWIEVREGLAGGEEVVDHGAFVLKSELLLEREEE